jgi:flavin-binding protein dodecin
MPDHVERGVIKIVELMGVSRQSFSDAARQAVAEAAKAIRGIRGIEVIQSSAKEASVGQAATPRHTRGVRAPARNPTW